MFRLQRVELFKQATAAFLQDRAPLFFDNVRIFRIAQEDGKEFVVFGVKREDQHRINFEELRIEMARVMGFTKPKQYIQFIGDSALYSKEGTLHAKHKIDQILSHDKDSIVLYGYTGSKQKEGAERRDINQLLSDWVDEDTSRASRVVANIVDEHTITAINKWDCTVSENVHNFFLVYSDTKEPSVKFGDDIMSSDGLTNLKAYSFEGGIQSLRQIVYMLKRDVAIHGISNLRDLSDSTNPRYFDPVSKKSYLSAVEFLQSIKESSDGFVKASEDYLATHALYNKSKGDASTKDALWVAAYADLVSGVWKKLSRFTCESSPKIMAENVSAAALVARLQQQTRSISVISIPETTVKAKL